MVSNDFCNIHSAKQGCSLGQHVFMCLRDQKSSTSASLPHVCQFPQQWISSPGRNIEELKLRRITRSVLKKSHIDEMWQTSMPSHTLYKRPHNLTKRKKYPPYLFSMFKASDLAFLCCIHWQQYWWM